MGHQMYNSGSRPKNVKSDEDNFKREGGHCGTSNVLCEYQLTVYSGQHQFSESKIKEILSI
jgi:hypothetical protein